MPQSEFKIEDLIDRWDIIVEKLKKTDVRMYAALKTVKPVLDGASKVIISLQNNAQVEEFQARLRPVIQSDLRENLNNNTIEVMGTVIEAEKLERPNFLTENEKLQKMIDKNPALQQLRSKFKLDFE